MKWEYRLCRICGSPKTHVARNMNTTMCGKCSPSVRMIGSGRREQVDCRSCAGAADAYIKEHGYDLVMDAYQKAIIERI